MRRVEPVSCDARGPPPHVAGTGSPISTPNERIRFTTRSARGWPVSFVVLAGMWAAMNGSLAALLADGIYIGGGVLVVILIILVVLLLMRRGV